MEYTEHGTRCRRSGGRTRVVTLSWRVEPVRPRARVRDGCGTVPAQASSRRCSRVVQGALPAPGAPGRTWANAIALEETFIREARKPATPARRGESAGARGQPGSPTTTAALLCPVRGAWTPAKRPPGQRSARPVRRRRDSRARRGTMDVRSFLPPGYRGTAAHRGMFPCFLGGRVSRLSRSMAKPRVTWPRVCAGTMTEST